MDHSTVSYWKVLFQVPNNRAKFTSIPTSRSRLPLDLRWPRPAAAEARRRTRVVLIRSDWWSNRARNKQSPAHQQKQRKWPVQLQPPQGVVTTIKSEKSLSFFGFWLFSGLIFLKMLKKPEIKRDKLAKPGVFHKIEVWANSCAKIFYIQDFFWGKNIGFSWWIMEFLKD